MRKNKPPLTAPVPVNVQRADRPPLVSATGEKRRGLRCHKLHVDLPFPPAGPSWDRAAWGTRWGGGGQKAYCVCVILTHAGQMGPTQSLAACALLTCVWVFM